MSAPASPPSAPAPSGDHFVRIMLLSGSLRRGSTNTALLRTAQVAAPESVATTFYEGANDLPHFNPDLDFEPLRPAVVALRAGIGSVDCVLISTPEYAGALPASLKNVLEWAVGDGQTGSIYEKPVAWVNVSASPTGAADAHESLRKVLAYLHALIVEAACVAIPVTRDQVGDDGLIIEPLIRTKVAGILDTLAAFVREHAAEHSIQNLG